MIPSFTQSHSSCSACFTKRQSFVAKFRFLFNTPQRSLLRLQLNCHTNVTFLLKCLSPSSSSSPRRRDSKYPISSKDYLVSSLGLSPESATKITQHIDLKSTSNADLVLALFADYGFTPTHIATIFSKRPVLLSYDPDENLKPKLDFFAQNGVSGDALFRIITRDPGVLTRSLDKIIVPCFNFLMTFFAGDTRGVVSLFSVKRGTWVLHNFSETTAPNVETLRSYGVPDANIVKLFLVGARTLSRDADEFHEISKEVIEMGFDPMSLMFVHGLRAFTMVKREKWLSKLELMKKSFGWTDEEVQALFVKQPTFMALSEERLKEGLELFMNRLGWTVDDIAKYPRLLASSFEKRIFPRLAVVEILMSKGLVKKTCMGYAFKVSERAFLSRFVGKYEEEIPHLLEVYREEMGKCKS